MIHSLSKDNYSIKVSSLGAELISVEKGGKNYLWTKTQPFWQRHAPVLFPVVGKLKNNIYLYQGKEYTLPQHGFARDSEFELTKETGDNLLFRLEENKNPNYPFQFDFFIKYAIDAIGLKTTYIIENIGEDILPFSVGAHPGFVCPFHENEKLEDYYFEFDSDEILSRSLLQEGLITDNIQTIQLNDRKLFLSEELFKNDALVLSGFRSKSVILKSKKYALKVSWDDCSFLGLWKQPGAPLVCIEPWWGVADSTTHNQNINIKRGINLLKPKGKREFWFRIEIQQPERDFDS